MSEDSETEWKQKLPRPVFPGDFTFTPLTKADLRRMNRIRQPSKLARRCAARGRG